MLDQQDPETWMELPYQEPEQAAQATAPAARPRNMDEGRPAAYGCQCWRCQGGWIALADRPILDKILAKHLMRMSESARDEWLLDWAAQPKHRKPDQDQLNAWLRIVGGSDEPAPAYPVYTVPGAA
ncbi:hypothetical protein [Achromobacter insolitus]|uniref:hypothetical protein n=1 Tax=Achromobacter insolitus TaxID=217204 RepID=UPI002FE0C95E